MNSFNDVFELMKEKTISSLNLSEQAVNLWINPIKPISMNGNRITLYISDSYAKGIIEKNHDVIFKTQFKDIRPSRSAVSSPNSFAARACELS